MEPESVKGILSSIETYLNPNIFTHQETLQAINENLGNGKLVVIRNALKDAFAQRMFTCLDQHTEWKGYEQYQKHFHYHHHNLYEPRLFPPDLGLCREIFQSDSTKTFIQGLSQRDCQGRTLFSASWFLPGDYSFPHRDLVAAGDNEYRQVSFVWHLTKNWQSNWGGELFWCPRNRYLSPSFNTLVLFTIGRDSWHFVTPVSPYAQSKRLAINGWWTGKSNDVEPADNDRDKISDEESLIEFI
jgi:hypothetical protein